MQYCSICPYRQFITPFISYDHCIIFHLLPHFVQKDHSWRGRKIRGTILGELVYNGGCKRTLYTYSIVCLGVRIEHEILENRHLSRHCINHEVFTSISVCYVKLKCIVRRLKCREEGVGSFKVKCTKNS